MALTPEGKVKAALRKKVLDPMGWPYNTVTTHGRGRSGHPDFTVNAAGRYVLIETKVDKPTPTALQHNELERHAKAGALGFVLARTGLRVYAPVTGQTVSIPTPDLSTALDLLRLRILTHIRP